MATSPSQPGSVPTTPLTAAELLTEFRLARAHSEAVIGGLDPAQVAWRPHDNASAIGWHLGHQAAVAHYLLRNLTAAEPPLDPALDRLFDSATPEPERGTLPPLADLLDYRARSAAAVDTTIGRILAGDVGAPRQLHAIADGLLRAITNHEYQHAIWMAEVRATLTDTPAPTPGSTNLVSIEGYPLVRP